MSVAALGDLVLDRLGSRLRLPAAMGMAPSPWQALMLREMRGTDPFSAIVRGSRRIGKSQLVAWAAVESIDELRRLLGRPIRVLIATHRQEASSNLLAAVRVASLVASRWSGDLVATMDSTTRLLFADGSTVKALPGNSGAARSESADVLIIDEAAHIGMGGVGRSSLSMAKQAEVIGGGLLPTLANAPVPRLLVISTPLAPRGWFHRTFESESAEDDEASDVAGLRQFDEFGDLSQADWVGETAGLDWLRVEVPWWESPLLCAGHDDDGRPLPTSQLYSIRASLDSRTFAREFAVSPDDDGDSHPAFSRASLFGLADEVDDLLDDDGDLAPIDLSEYSSHDLVGAEPVEPIAALPDDWALPTSLADLD